MNIKRSYCEIKKDPFSVLRWKEVFFLFYNYNREGP